MNGHGMSGTLCAPQYGIHCGMPPATDNPAAVRPVPCPANIRLQILQLRNEAAARYHVLRGSAVAVWR